MRYKLQTWDPKLYCPACDSILLHSNLVPKYNVICRACNIIYNRNKLIRKLEEEDNIDDNYVDIKVSVTHHESTSDN